MFTMYGGNGKTWTEMTPEKRNKVDLYLFNCA